MFLSCVKYFKMKVEEIKAKHNGNYEKLIFSRNIQQSLEKIYRVTKDYPLDMHSVELYNRKKPIMQKPEISITVNFL